MALFLFALIAFLGEPNSSSSSSDTASSKQTFDARNAYATAAGMLASGKYEQAQHYLAQILELAPDFAFSANAALRLAECQLALKQPNEAANTLTLWYGRAIESEQALALEPDLPSKLDSVALHTADILANSKDSQAQLVALAQALIANAKCDGDTRPRLFLKVSEHFESCNDFEAAEKWNRLALEALPTLPGPSVERSNLHDSLRTSLRERLDFTLPMNRARWAISRKEFGLAISELEELNQQATSLQLSETQQIALQFQLAEALQLAGQTEKALQQWNELSLQAGTMTVPPDWYATPMIRQVELLLRTNRYSEAAEILAHSSVDVDDAVASELRFLKARCAIQAIDFAKAEEYLRTNLTKHSKLTLIAVKSQWLLGELYLLKRDYPQAIACYELAATATDYPQWASLAQFQAARCLEAMGDTAAAQAKYAVVVANYPDQLVASKANERIVDVNNAEQPSRTADASPKHPTYNASAR